MKYFFPLFVFFLASQILDAQNFSRLQVPVEFNDQVLTNAWAGGLNAPQWCKADLDNDGDEDLYAFDRVGHTHIAFRNDGTGGTSAYHFAPELTAHFPEGRNFGILRDYNTDGAPDLFVHAGDIGIAGMKVFKGFFVGNELHFEQVLTPQWIFDVLVYSQSPGTYTNVLVNLTDYPAIDDMDGDGDLDILAIGSTGSYVAYYENTAIEMGYTDDTMFFELRDQCWGKLYIAPFSEEFTLSNNSTQCALFTGHDPNDDRGGLHGGGTLATFDADNDGDKELLYGDLIYPKITYGFNGGTNENAWVTDQDPNFPSYNESVNIPYFPAAYILDFDNDGLKDLLVSPNDTKKTPDRETVWFYRNTQSNEAPHFELQQKDAIGNTMLDFGSGAQPAIADVNGDGLLDIVVGNYNYWTPDEPTVEPDVPGLYLLLNTGTASEPAFELVDTDWLGFSIFKEEAFAFAPAFGDLDGDGDLDLLVGERYGSLIFAENTAGPGNPMNFAPLQTNWQDINVGQYATPFIFDMDEDGDPDLVIGERNGNINYLPNLGSATAPSFHPNPDEAPNNRLLGKISTQQPGYPTGYSTPVILPFENETFLLTGSEFGWMEAYLVDKDSLSGGSFQLVSEKFGNLRDGQETRMAFADLDGDDFLEMIMGNRRGGIGLWRSPFHVTGGLTVATHDPELSMQLQAWPNPTGSELFVSIPEDVSGTIEARIFDLQGRQLKQENLSGKLLRMDVSELTPGVYFVQVIAGQRFGTLRFIKS
ncbi:MAG: hypothetical protein Kow0027_31180 [Saprospiraceae bacterium]